MATTDGGAFTKFATRIGYTKHAHKSLESDVHGMENVTQNALGGTTNTDWGGQCDITCVILGHEVKLATDCVFVNIYIDKISLYGLTAQKPNPGLGQLLPYSISGHCIGD